VDTGLASAVSGSLVPTAQPFLYSLSATATSGTPLARVEEAITAAIDTVQRAGTTADELTRAKHQLRARMIFENDSVTSIGHQLGYFETIASWRAFHAIAGQIEAVSLDAVNAAAALRLAPRTRTVGWFDPQPE
jgi:zinc protease